MQLVGVFDLRREDGLSELEEATKRALTSMPDSGSTTTRSTSFRSSGQTTSMAR